MAETGVTAPADAKAAPAVDPKAQAGAVKTPEAATREIVVNGQKLKVTEAQLIALAQKGHFADQKLKSMDVLAKSSQALLEALKTPEGLLGILKDPKLGASPKEVFKKLMASDVIDDELKETMEKWVYENSVRKAKLSPEEAEKETKLSEYERLKKQEDERKKSEALSQQNAQVQQVYQAVRAEVTKQIVADKTFPQTEGSIRQVVEKLRVMNKKGATITTENVTKAIAQVKKDHLLHQQTLFDAIEDPEALIAFFGEARALKISKALVARLKAKGAAKLEKKEADGEGNKNLTDRVRERFGRDRHGYQVIKLPGE